MVYRSAVPRRLLAAALTIVVAAVVVVGWTPALGGGRPYPEAPMRVVTGGLTAEEGSQRQAELRARLSDELPSSARNAAIRIPFTREEIDALDLASRSSVPLKIGLVKAMTPGVEIAGLTSSRSGHQATRGTTGLAERTSDGGYVWALVVASPDAGAIRLHVEDLSLPGNAELYYYGPDGQAYGPYTGMGPHGTGEFWTATVFGSEAVLQVRVSGTGGEAALRAVSFNVLEAGLITRNFVEGLLPSAAAAPLASGWPCGNASCIVDASCVSGTPADPAKLAVAKMEWVKGAYIYTCSGGLINDNNPAQSDFFLTANHCVSRNNTAQNVNFYWRFATSSCNDTSCPSNSAWPYQTSGSTVAKTGRKGDFTLLHLDSSPPSGSVFLGWTSAPVANTNGADLYRVSNPNFGPQVYSRHDVDTSAGTCSSWPRGERIYSRDIVGAIGGGSSGSPIINASSQIVGQLSGTCGLNPGSSCSSGPGEDNATVDGAFAFYFSSVQPILSP